MLKNVLLGFVALAFICGAVSVTMYFQSLMLERKYKREVSDEYYLTDLRINDIYYCMHPKDLKKLKKRMHSDGYSYAEIGIMEKKARKIAYDDYVDRQKVGQQLQSGEYEWEIID